MSPLSPSSAPHFSASSDELKILFISWSMLRRAGERKAADRCRAQEAGEDIAPLLRNMTNKGELPVKVPHFHYLALDRFPAPRFDNLI